MTENTDHWLDMTQIAPLFPHLSISAVYELLGRAANRAPRKERRSMGESGKVRRVIIWSPAEVEAAKLLAMRVIPRRRYTIVPPPSPFPPTLPPKLSDNPANTDVDTLLGWLRDALEEQWRARALAAEAERDALRAQLDRVKSLVGV